MALEVVVPGDGSDGSGFFQLQAGRSRQEHCVEYFGRRAKVGSSVPVLDAEVRCSSRCVQFWESAAEQYLSEFASKVF